MSKKTSARFKFASQEEEAIFLAKFAKDNNPKPLKIKQGKVKIDYSKLLFPALASIGLPNPEPEFKFCETRRWRFDFAWKEFKLALEIEGMVWRNGRHTRGSGFVKDMEKYNNAAKLGWRIIRATPDNFCKEEILDIIQHIIKNNGS